MLRDGVVRALGTMSGTSLDGVDAAVLQTDGVTIAGFGPADYRPYSADERAVLRAHLGCWPQDDLGQAPQVVEAAHLALMARFDDVDVAGFHGQTLAHDPAGRRTHQCGDGARLARDLGVPVVWDFRSEDMRQGGQGAPLAPFYHFALAKWLGLTQPVAFLNLGGVGNITWVDPAFDRPEAADALLAFDTGPANAPINDLMGDRFGTAFDTDGQVAAQGRANATVLARFDRHPYFDEAPPKSLDRNAFGQLQKDVADLSDADAVATVTQAAAIAVDKAMQHCPQPPSVVLVAGGGRRNGTLMRRLAGCLPCPVQPVEDVGLDGDMIEAHAFAYLAVRVARGLPTSAPGTTGGRLPVTGGIFSSAG